MSTTSTTYTTVAGDMWDLIAFTVYGDVRYTENLMAANPDPALLQIVIFDAGVVLQTPALPTSVTSNPGTPPWRL